MPASGVDRPTLVLSSDADLVDRLLRLAAAAGVELEVTRDAQRCHPAWSAAPMVLVGADLAPDIATAAPRRRSDVVLVSADLDDHRVWQYAMEVGAEHVALLPDGESWLVQRLAEAQRPSSEGLVLGVVGGRGGAGASTLAVALAFSGLRRGLQPLLVDGDPMGGGLDLVLGGEDVAGPRWPDLAAARGRLASSALGDALPHVQTLHVLSWDRGDVCEVPPEAMRTVLDAGARETGLVVVDLPRRPDDAARAALSRCDAVLLLVPAEVRAVASAGRVANAVGPFVRDLRVVVRGPAPTSLEPELVAESLGLALAGWCRAEPGIAAALDRGEPPGRTRGPLSRLADSLLGAFVPDRAVEA